MALRGRVDALRAPEPDGRAAVCKTAEAGSTPAGAFFLSPRVASAPGLLAGGVLDSNSPENARGFHPQSRRTTTTGRPGSIDLVQELAPRHGEIQGVGRADHRDADKVRAEVAQEGAEPLALLAEDEDRRAGIVAAMEPGRPVGRGADDAAAMAAEPVPE